jgi:RNA polymerase sigma factor, sigma-70 family
MELYTDTYYIKRVQSGDAECFSCLIDKYSRPIHSLVFRIVGNREDTEELTQDIFMKVYRNLDSFKGESSFSTWIYRIAYNTAISETRKKKYELLPFDDAVIDNITENDVANAFGHVDKTEQIETLEKALEDLSPDERALILLFYMKDKSIDEISDITGLSASNVKTKLHRIRKKLYILMTKKKEK